MQHHTISEHPPRFGSLPTRPGDPRQGASRSGPSARCSEAEPAPSFQLTPAARDSEHRGSAPQDPFRCSLIVVFCTALAGCRRGASRSPLSWRPGTVPGATTTPVPSRPGGSARPPPERQCRRDRGSCGRPTRAPRARPGGAQSGRVHQWPSLREARAPPPSSSPPTNPVET